jgi:putative effector of murein hydrolase LrgA (UPF0299 family)
MNELERQYRKSGQLLTMLFLFYMPAMALVALFLYKLTKTFWPIFVLAGLWMAAMTAISAWRFWAYFRWKGKYPFYWLR